MTSSSSDTPSPSSAGSSIPANDGVFCAFDGKTYSIDGAAEGKYDISHDGRFWHISFPIVGEPGWIQIYRGRKLPQAADVDRWVRYRPTPPKLPKRSSVSL